ncbi:MAG: hypothetical protein AAFX10_07370, partial [Pseudomonadota bacterium]
CAHIFNCFSIPKVIGCLCAPILSPTFGIYRATANDWSGDQKEDQAILMHRFKKYGRLVSVNIRRLASGNSTDRFQRRTASSLR